MAELIHSWKGCNPTPQALAGQLPWEGSLCCQEAQAYDMYPTLILESLGIQAVERVDYRLGNVCTQIQAIFLPPEEAPLKGSWPVGPEGFKTQEYELALPKVGGQGAVVAPNRYQLVQTLQPISP